MTGLMSLRRIEYFFFAYFVNGPSGEHKIGKHELVPLGRVKLADAEAWFSF